VLSAALTATGCAATPDAWITIKPKLVLLTSEGAEQASDSLPGQK